MPASESNPFSQARETRDKPFHFRMTESEYTAVKAIADREGKDITDLIREGLAAVIGRRQAATGAGRRPNRRASS